MLSIKKRLAGVAVTGAFAVAGVAGFTAPASASTGVHVAMAGAHVAATGPNTSIKGSPAKWSPTTLTGAPATGTCSGTNNTFTITNTEAKAETVLYNTGSGKKLLGTLKAHTKYDICGSGSAGAKTKFYIKGSTSVLTVTLS